MAPYRRRPRWRGTEPHPIEGSRPITDGTHDDRPNTQRLFIDPRQPPQLSPPDRLWEPWPRLLVLANIAAEPRRRVSGRSRAVYFVCGTRRLSPAAIRVRAILHREREGDNISRPKGRTLE